jgi:hypothetical protein
MRSRRQWLPIAVTGFITLSILASAQNQDALPNYSLLDAMVWGADLRIDTTTYAPDVKAQIEQLWQRSEAYQSKRVKPTGSSELRMVYDAQVRYERRLVAASTSPGADPLALAYVTELRPCYEWEGFSDCPEREAMFAAKYQTSHPTGPFSQYLPLLEAHRWLCAAEAYESEKAPAEAARARRAYEQALSIARQSSSLLVRTAAGELGPRARCSVERHPAEHRRAEHGDGAGLQALAADGARGDHEAPRLKLERYTDGFRIGWRTTQGAATMTAPW